ncbi:hypothetical protein D3C75_1141050 [compost metagenome]
MTSPLNTTGLAPILSKSLPPIIMAMKDITACGMMSSPDSKEENPRTCCKNNGINRIEPNKAIWLTQLSTIPLVKSNERNERSSSRAFCCVNSTIMNRTSAVRLPIKAMIV